MAEKNKPSMLVLGMGTGTYALESRKYFPQLSVSGVEIDGKITQLAHRYFNLPTDIPVTTYDGRAYLNADQNQYDVIMVDAYQDITIPFQMSSAEFFTLVKAHLKPNGVMVVNMNMHNGAKGNINEYLSDTIASVFANVYTVDVRGYTNRELFATDDDAVMEHFDTQIADLKDQDLGMLMRQIKDDMIPYHAGNLIFTDDRAPVELMGMRVIDSMIQDEIGYYKDLYKEKGLQGLMEQM